MPLSARKNRPRPQGQRRGAGEQPSLILLSGSTLSGCCAHAISILSMMLFLVKRAAMMSTPLFRFLAAAGLAFGLTGLLAGCAPSVVTRGNLLDPDRLADVRVGTTTREEVGALLGTPNTAGTFDPSVWYYIGLRTEKTAFFNPEVVEHKVVRVRFNSQGIVQAVDTLDPTAAQPVEIVDRSTPSLGHDQTVLQQLLANVGRFPGGGLGAARSGNTGASTTRRPY